MKTQPIILHSHWHQFAKNLSLEEKGILFDFIYTYPIHKVMPDISDDQPHLQLAIQYFADKLRDINGFEEQTKSKWLGIDDITIFPEHLSNVEIDTIIDMELKNKKL